MLAGMDYVEVDVCNNMPQDGCSPVGKGGNNIQLRGGQGDALSAGVKPPDPS